MYASMASEMETKWLLSEEASHEVRLQVCSRTHSCPLIALLAKYLLWSLSHVGPAL